jgi:hypothetical protein
VHCLLHFHALLRDFLLLQHRQLSLPQPARLLLSGNLLRHHDVAVLRDVRELQDMRLRELQQVRLECFRVLPIFSVFELARS